MELLTTAGWHDYELLDSGEGLRLERFGKFILSRPDPQIIWKKTLPQNIWEQVDAYFKRTEKDKGIWVKKNKRMPDSWQMHYNNLSFLVKLSPFKHTGVFPEQHLMWDFISNVITNRVKQSQTNNDIAASTFSPRNDEEHKPNVLNLFAYTGIATLAAAAAGAKVTHVDASKPTIAWAKANQEASGLAEKPIRWIMDDCLKFVEREIKRGNTYDGIIMDPPAFGHGPTGQMWKFNENFPKLLHLSKQLLSQKPLFVIVNAYAISSSSLMLENVMKDYLGDLKGTIEVGELVLQESQNNRLLSTGIFGRWSK